MNWMKSCLRQRVDIGAYLLNGVSSGIRGSKHNIAYSNVGCSLLATMIWEIYPACLELEIPLQF